MQIILSKRNRGKVLDAIEYVLNADEKEFRRILRVLKSNNEILDFAYQEEIDNQEITQELFHVSEFMVELHNMSQNPMDKRQEKRIQKLQKYRTEDALKKKIISDYNLPKSVIDGLFSMLAGNEEFNEFLKNAEMEKGQRSRKILPFDLKRTKKLPAEETDRRDYFLGILNRIIQREYSWDYFMPEYDKYQRTYRNIDNKIRSQRLISSYSIVIRRWG